MATRTEREILNHLIERCHDAERGFRLAANEAVAPELRQKFLDLAEQRRQFAAALLPHAQRLGGARDAEGTAEAAIHRAWIQVKARLAKDRDRVLLREAARGEGYTVAAFDDAVNDILPPEVRDLVEAEDEDVQLALSQLVAALKR
jgi:uncharacterized protein (TIGR02284 family)